MKPFIRWVGGKRKLLNEILSLPGVAGIQFDHYYEPFVGGGAMFFEHGRYSPHCEISDININLMDTYAGIQRNPDLVLEIIHSLKGESYQVIKDEFNHKPKIGHCRIAALFLMLNHLCFNGLYRTNKKGEFNVPVGKHGSTVKGTNRPRTMEDFPYDAIMPASAALRNTNIRSSSFKESLKYAEIVPGSTLVFCDPPYLAEFSNYDKSGFGVQDHQELDAVARVLSHKGALVVVCGSDNSASREIYGAPNKVVELQRTVGASNRGKAREAFWVYEASHH